MARRCERLERGCLKLPKVLEIATQAGSALAVAHEAGICTGRAP